jgi:hypothetical protein
MELRFPKARLFAYDKILQGQSCPSVLMHAIVDAGLLSESSFRGLGEESCSKDFCQSANAAEGILNAYMTEYHEPIEAKRLARAAIAHLKSDLDGWRAQRDSDHVTGGRNECRENAPVVLDLLLQQLLKH